MEDRNRQNRKTDRLLAKFSNRAVKMLLTVSGTLSLFLGIVGIFLPILPTTPFLLLAAFCYAKSSEKFYYMLLNNRYLGNYIKNYREQKAVPMKIKISSISLLWITILISAFCFIENNIIRGVLILIASAVTFHISSLKTLK